MNKKDSLILLLVLLVVLSVLPHPPSSAGKMVTVKGIVKEHSTGNPIPQANILVLRRSYWWGYQRWEKAFHGEVDSSGCFALELFGGQRYIIYAYYDDPLTPGFDYVPSMKSIWTPPSGGLNMTFELWEGASMFLEGEALFVETTEPAQSSYSVLDPDSGNVIKLGEYTLNYGEGTSSHNSLLGLSPNHIIVPADMLFMIKVNSMIKVGKETMTRSFLIDKPSHFVLGKGEAIHVNMMKYCLPFSLSTIRVEASEVGLMLDEREEEGFYLTVERQRLAQINFLILEAENLLDQGAYEASFTRLREAYVEISNLRNWLNRMYTEALKSVFLLIPFMAFAATTISYLLFEEKVPKVIGASAFYAVFLPALYLLYPGSRLIEAFLFLEASLISLVAVLGLSALLPRFLRGRGLKGRVLMRNMVIPIFSIAKRSLRRRRLRFILTLTSVMILVSSFVALTSFTTGFGLTFRRVSGPVPTMGVLVRAPKPPAGLLSQGKIIRLEWGGFSWFLPLDNSSIEWFEARPETRLVVPKFESLPHRQYLEDYDPLGEVYSRVPVTIHLDRDGVWTETHWVPIFGIIGITPSAEAEVLGLNETIIEGGYLSDEDENGVLISAKLKKKMNATVGETLTLRISKKILKLKIIGVFDDKRFEDLRDLDGQSLLPMKIINANTLPREPDEPISVIEELAPCSTDETLVVTWRTALKIPDIHLSRLNIILEGDLKEYAKMMALNKGFRAWASTEEGVYLAQLASYFEGKGLPITIPWLIVVLNVVVTMLNSLYERKSEIFIYSSIGMNPSHISSIFIAEAAIIGVIGGGIGYLLGLGWYRAMSLLSLALQVRQKISALWVVAAIAVSMAAVLVGSLFALRGSVVITPSLRRKWGIEQGLRTSMEPLELALPVRVAEAEVEEFVKYVLMRLKSHMEDPDFVTSQIREGVEKSGEAIIRRIEFIYRSVYTTVCGSYIKNKLILRRERTGEVYTVKLLSDGDIEGIRRAGSFIRKIIMEWSIERGRIEKKTE